MNFHLIPALFASLSLACAAQAATFDTTADFFAGNDVAFTETFSSLGDDTRTINGPLTLATGITASSQSNNLAALETGFSGNTSVALSSDRPRDDSLTIGLGGLFSAFGLEIFQNNGGRRQLDDPTPFTVTAFLGDTLIDTFTTDVAPGAGSFFGFNSDSLFDSVNIFSNENLFEVVDNISAGFAADAPAPVPLPASLPLLVAGFAALGFAAKRRNT